jgi:hypothetical protein
MVRRDGTPGLVLAQEQSGTSQEQAREPVAVDSGNSETSKPLVIVPPAVRPEALKIDSSPAKAGTVYDLAGSRGSNSIFLTDPIAIGLETALVVSIFVFLVSLLRWRRARARLSRSEQSIATALGKPGLKLRDAPAAIGRIEDLMADLFNQNGALREALAEAKGQPKKEPGHGLKRVLAVADCLDEAAVAAEALKADVDFQSFERTLELTNGLRGCAKILRSLPDDPALDPELRDILERGTLDLVLTTRGLLDAYFSDRPSWRSIRAMVRAADALLVAALEARGIEIVQTSPLTVVSRSDLRDAVPADRRNLRYVQPIQQKAARLARNLGPTEFLVVDCHRPGWIFGQVRRSPGLAIFDPASWT